MPAGFDYSVAVIAHNSIDWLLSCLEQLCASVGPRCALVVVDNASHDRSVNAVQHRFPDLPVIQNSMNLGFTGGANVAIRAAATDVVVILNPDIEVGSSTLVNLVGALETTRRTAIVGCKLLYPDGNTIQHAGGVISYPQALPNHHGYGEDDRGQYDEVREVDYVTGAAFAVRKSVLEAIGYFDEGFYPAYFEEADLCLRARQAGYKVLYVPDAVAIHHESVTTGKNTATYYRFFHRNRIRFVLKHYSDEQLTSDFLPAERDWLGRLESSVELVALRAAYVDNRAVLEGRADFLANPSAAAELPKSPRRIEVLRALEAGVEEALLLNRPGRPSARDRVDNLRARSRLAEPGFASGAPIVGPLVIRVRRAWNWMSTKWYVRPIAEQQTEFNVLAAEALRELTRSLEVLEARLSEIEVANNEAQDARRSLEARLRHVEARLADLDRQPDPGTGRPGNAERQEPPGH